MLRAINEKYANVNTLKFSRNNYMSDNHNTFSSTLLKHANCCLLQKSIESSVTGDFGYLMTFVAASARNGPFSNCDATRSMIKAVAIKAERKKNWKDNLRHEN